MGPWHAPVIFNDDEDRWYITHAGTSPFGKRSTTRQYRPPYTGMFMGGLMWSEGVPVPVDLADVMEDWP